MSRIYEAAGGRKMFAQYLAATLVTAMAFVLRPAFWEYAVAVCGVLGIGVGSIAYEDARRAREMDAGEASPGYRRPAGWAPEPDAEVDEP
jgi:hypothetical protein